MPSIQFLAVASIFSLLTPPILAQSIDWNQWRGPNRDSKLPAAKWPDSLQNRLELLWEHPHGPSYSGPVVSRGRVFTTETIDKTTERVTAYDLATGDLGWTAQWPGSMAVPFFAAANGDWIRSTPACTEDHLLVLGMRDVLVCLDPASGNQRWRVDFPAQMGTSLPSFGAVCSPLIDGGAAYVQTGGAVVKLSLSGGNLIWKTLENASGMMSSGAFSSPVIANIAGKRQLVVQTREALCGVDLESGKVLWKEPIEAFRGMNILTPLVIGDRVFTSAYKGSAQLFQIGRTDDDRWHVTEVWNQKTQAYMSSPLLMDDSVVVHLRNQRVTSLAVDDGSIRWTSTPFGKYWSMVSNGDRILALDNRGELLLVAKSGSSLDVLDRMRVAEDSWAHLAVQGDHVIIRDLGALKVFRWQ